MKVNFISRQEAIQLVQKGYFNHTNTDLISINDNDDEEFEMRSAWDQFSNKNNATFFIFRDEDSDDSGFSLEDASVMISAIEQAINSNNDIVVHCWAGISRSGAVAKFINDYLKIDSPHLNTYNLHNRFIYKRLMTALENSMSNASVITHFPEMIIRQEIYYTLGDDKNEIFQGIVESYDKLTQTFMVKRYFDDSNQKVDMVSNLDIKWDNLI